LTFYWLIKSRIWNLLFLSRVLAKNHVIQTNYQKIDFIGKTCPSVDHWFDDHRTGTLEKRDEAWVLDWKNTTGTRYPEILSEIQKKQR